MLPKQTIPINFVKGVDTKTDPYQIPLGSFANLTNSVFTTTGRLTKRSGFDNITTLPNALQTTLTTYNETLIATGSNLYSFSPTTDEWLNKGTIQPVELSTMPLLRSNTSQSSPDIAIASTGLSCMVYVDSGVSYYQIFDSATAQVIITPQVLSNSAINPRVFVLNKFFIVMYSGVVAATPTLQFIAIPINNPSLPFAAQDLSSNLSSQTTGYDGFVVNNRLYVSWGGGGTTVKTAFISSSLVVSGVSTIAAHSSTLMSVTADTSTRRVFISFWDSGSTNGYTAAYDYSLNQVMAVTQIITTTSIRTITSLGLIGTLHVFYENVNAYSYNSSIPTDFVSTVTLILPAVATNPGTITAPEVVLRSVGLASKAFSDSSNNIYMMAVYGQNTGTPSTTTNQSTYFLINSAGSIYEKLAYANAGGYAQTQVIPSIPALNGNNYFPYMITDFLAAVNKGVSLPSGTPVNAIYTQTGINLATFSINTSGQQSTEIAKALHLTGGQLWEYDGIKPVEHGFHLWPENIDLGTSTVSGGLTAQTYYYVFTYEWTDNQGMLHRSAPSIPAKIVTTGTHSTNTCNIPTLRATSKRPPNPVRIVGYRWSTTQQVFYQFTSLSSPTLNDTTIDSVTITDALADSAILGNTILYTTGGVIENIGAPACIDTALFDNRLFLIDAEDRNLLWFSKQIIENTPVEMSDLLTLFIAPTTGAQGSTGPMYALSAMDDKLIIFKKDAIYYINGTGPDNTGANNGYSQPTFITAAVGTINPNSIILMPNGVMFQSDKGIYLLGRDLSTTYIGAPVEGFNSLEIMSAEVIPGTTQVRFVSQNNTTLMYDYYYNQWGIHTNVSAVSATLYQGLHTYLNVFGQVYQEQANRYTDASTPVLLSLTTSWLNLAGLQGFERFYFAYLLGTYYTPFKLNIQFAYDYNPSPTKAIIVTPDNFAPAWGGEALWGSGNSWGGPGNQFKARIFPDTQKCESFQVTIQEVYDASLGAQPGQGLSLSGLDLVIGTKRGFRTQNAKRSFG